MRKVIIFPRTPLALLLAGVLAGCVGGSIPVAEQHPSGPDIGSILARQQAEQAPKSANSSTAAVASVASGRAGATAAMFAAPAGGSGGHASGHGGGPGGAR